MGRHYRLIAIFFSVVLISAPYCEAQSTSLKSWFGSKAGGESANPQTQSPPKKSLALRDRMGFRSLAKQPIQQPTSTKDVAQVGFDQPAEPQIPDVVVSQAPFASGDDGTAVLSLVPTDLASEPTRLYQDANANGLVPEVMITKDLPLAISSNNQAPSAVIPAPLPMIEEPNSQLPNGINGSGIVGVQPTVPNDGPKPVIAQPSLVARSTAAPVRTVANPISYVPPVKPVLDSALGIIGGMDNPQPLPTNTVASNLPPVESLPKSPDQVQLMPFKAGSPVPVATTSVASLEPKPATETSSTLISGVEGQEFVLKAPQRKAERMLSLPIDVLPFNKLISASLAADSTRTYATEEMVGPLGGAASLVSRLNVDNDFRYQAATPINMTRVSADASGMGPEWMQSNYAWVAPTFHHKPLYFEQPNLERYGYGPKLALQPFASGAHFFASVTMLPYKMLTQHPYEKVYPLGNNRPGDCVPYQKRTLIGQSYLGEVMKYHEPGSGY